MKEMNEAELEAALFIALKQEPEGQLSHDFSNNVAERVQARKTLRLALAYWFIGVIIAVGAGLGCLWLLSQAPLNTYGKTIEPVFRYKWIGLTALFAFFAGKLVDLKLTSDSLGRRRDAVS